MKVIILNRWIRDDAYPSSPIPSLPQDGKMIYKMTLKVSLVTQVTYFCSFFLHRPNAVRCELISASVFNSNLAGPNFCVKCQKKSWMKIVNFIIHSSGGHLICVKSVKIDSVFALKCSLLLAFCKTNLVSILHNYSMQGSF